MAVRPGLRGRRRAACEMSRAPGDARDQIDRAAESRRDGDELSGSVTDLPVSVGERRARDASLTRRPHPSNCRAVRLEVFPETSWNARLVGRHRVTRRTVPSGFPCADRESFLSRFLGGEGPRTPPGRSIRFPISRFRVVLEWSLERSGRAFGASPGEPSLGKDLGAAASPQGRSGTRPRATLSALHPAKRPTHRAAPPPAPPASTPPRTADSPPPRGSFAPGRS